MEWQMKKSAWDVDGLQARSDSTRTPHGNRQWGLQDSGLLFPGLGTTQKTHFPTSSSSGTTTGSLDSASSGFPVPTLSCSSELLLGPCATHDPGKLRNGWLFGDKEIDVTSSDKRGLPRVASGFKLENSDKQQNQGLGTMVEKSGSGLYVSSNGRTAPERPPPKVDIIKNSQASGTTPAPIKRPPREDTADEGVKMSSGAGVSVATCSPLPPVKKPRITAPGVQISRCQVEGCKADLTAARDYHRRHKVCANHSKAPKVITSGIEQRFCQQCSRFHVLSEFDDAKRSCRRRLAGHNERRRKSSQDTRALTVASMLQDERQQLSGFMDRPYYMQRPLGMPLSIYDNGSTRRGWSRMELEQQLAMACRTQSTHPYSTDRLLMILQACKGTTPDSQSLSMSSSQSPNMLAGVEGVVSSAPLGTHPGLLDSGRALSLLSSQTRSNHVALEKLMSEPATSLSFQHQQYLPDNPITTTGSPSAFSVADYQLNHQKLLALQSSPQSLALSIGMSTDAVEDTHQHQKPQISNFNVAETLETNPMLAHLLQRPEFRNLGGSSSQHAKLSSPAMELQSQQNHHQQFVTSELQATDFSQQVQPFRGVHAEGMRCKSLD